MKFISFILSLFLFASCVNGKEKIYTGSTPANSVVKTFLGISLSDSIDFIRWKLTLDNTKYQLLCNYGIGKPNTNGFINGGNKIELNGQFKRENNYLVLLNEGKALNIVNVNSDLLHFSDNNNKLLVGNGGWSYTLNSLSPSGIDQMNLFTSQTLLKDSLVFDGRTPCNIPGISEAGKECYKLK
jgi:hypothetical protein